MADLMGMSHLRLTLKALVKGLAQSMQDMPCQNVPLEQLPRHQERVWYSLYNHVPGCAVAEQHEV